MPPLAFWLVALIVSVVGTACVVDGDASISSPSPVSAPSMATPIITPFVVDIPARTLEPVEGLEAEATPTPLEIFPLDILVPEATPYLTSRKGQIGIAVVIPVEGVAYVYNGDTGFPMASVAKVPIMLTVLSQVDETGRSLNEYEQELLTQMITVSDNLDAYALWDAVGGAAEVSEYLSSIGIDGIVPNVRYWGESQALALDVAEMLAMLANGSILSEAGTALAMDLLEGVNEAQDWGVPSGAAMDSDVTVVGVKNGWYPAPDGWRVNSVGYVRSEDNKIKYAIAVLSNEQPSLEYGIETIEWLSQLLHPILVD